ncbi:MAG: hypothetical protein IPJ25_08610 [Rhodocyclaceae bacterium]|nr:hypothetical protein [Rhodocyclaceae bacterium]
MFSLLYSYRSKQQCFQCRYADNTVTGTNDAAIITPQTTADPETNAALTTGSTMVISDVVSASTFHGADGGRWQQQLRHLPARQNAAVWIYTANSARDEFAAGGTYTDSVSVTRCRWHHQQHHGEHPGH